MLVSSSPFGVGPIPLFVPFHNFPSTVFLIGVCSEHVPTFAYSLLIKLACFIYVRSFFIILHHVNMASSPSGVSQHVPTLVFGGYGVERVNRDM